MTEFVNLFLSRADVQALDIVIDGIPVPDLRDEYLAVSPPFGMDLPDANIFGLPSGLIEPAVAGGWGVVVQPPATGAHEIEVTARIDIAPVFELPGPQLLEVGALYRISVVAPYPG